MCSNIATDAVFNRASNTIDIVGSAAALPCSSYDINFEAAPKTRSSSSADLIIRFGCHTVHIFDVIT